METITQFKPSGFRLTPRAFCTLSIGLSLGFAWQSASAVGISLDEVSVSGLGSAEAGAASEAQDASVVFYNPAALTRFKKAEQVVGAVVIKVNDSFQDQPDGSNGYPAGGVNYERAANYGLAPANFFAIPINSKLVMGIGISGSAGLILRYPNDYPGRFQSKSTDIKVTRLNVGMGYKLTPTLSLGANASIERFFQSIRTDVDYAKAAAAEPGLNGLFGNALTNPTVGNAFFTSTGSNRSVPLSLRLFGTKSNFQLGMLFEPTENTRAGLSFRPKTKFNLKGRYTFQAANPAILVQAAPALLSDGEVTQTITMPSELRASIFHHLNAKTDLMADITRYDYSGITNVAYYRDDGSTLKNYVQNLKAGNRYAVGMSYQAYKRLKWRLGLSMDQATSEDRYRVTALPDQMRHSLNTGIGLQISPTEWVDMAYQISVFKDAKIEDRTDLQGTQGEKSFDGNLAGTVKARAQFFGIQYRGYF